MCKAEADRNKMITLRFDNMMQSSETCVSRLMETIDKLPIWLQAEYILANAKSWAQQTRKTAAEQVRALIARLDELEEDIGERERRQQHLSGQVTALQDWKRKLEASIKQMVPRSELAVVKTELAQRQTAAAERISAMQEENALLRQENNDLKAKIQVPPLLLFIN